MMRAAGDSGFDPRSERLASSFYPGFGDPTFFPGEPGAVRSR
jgi:hypothetical protein